MDKECTEDLRLLLLAITTSRFLFDAHALAAVALTRLQQMQQPVPKAKLKDTDWYPPHD